MLVAPTSDDYYYGRVYPAVHCKPVTERELQFFITASDGGLTPKFRGYETHGKGPHVCYDMYSDAWDEDLAISWNTFRNWTPEEVDALVEAVHCLPGMLHSLHLLGIVHRDFAGQNVMIRRERPFNQPKFSIALIDFGHSASLALPPAWVTGYYLEDFEEDVEEDNKRLRDFMCQIGWESQRAELTCEICVRCRNQRALRENYEHQAAKK